MFSYSLCQHFQIFQEWGFHTRGFLLRRVQRCRAQSYLNQRQLLEMRWTLQRGTFPFTHRQVWHFCTCTGNKGNSRKNCLVQAASCHHLPCVRTPAPGSPGLNPELTTAECKAVLSISLSSGAKHIYFREFFHRERHSAPQHHTYCSCSHCKEWNHQWPSAQHLKPPYFTEQRKP